MPDFVHLHCHTQYSLLDGASNVKDMVSKAAADGMPGVAITDHGNMFGAFDFYLEATKQNIKPIIGCEFYVVEDRTIRKFDKGRKDDRKHQLLLAKNETGYRNLSKLCSLGFIEGYYSKFPRVDFELISKYSEGLIATTCCVAASVPQAFLHKGEEAAEQEFLKWKKLFGDDYYIELQRHHLQGINQEGVNQFLMKMSEKHNVKMIATNDSHYVDQEDWLAHDILLCVNTGDEMITPVGDRNDSRVRIVTEKNEFDYLTIDEARSKYPNDNKVRQMDQFIRENRFKPRFGFENDQFYFKNSEEMATLFSDVPQAIDNTLEIFEKVQTPKLSRDILLPNYTLPEGFSAMTEYLRHLAYEGARRRYGEINEIVRERLDHELKVIDSMGFPGYFLIVQDLIKAAREMGVRVGPGRGSAAGSAVAYCTGITDIDPIKYNLLFERFLNPERISMPDIDIDFDDINRQKVIDYVVKKYGKNQVAQIITYGKMAAKSSIRDVGRVLKYPLGDTDALAKKVSDTKLKDELVNNEELKKVLDSGGEAAEVLKLAGTLEGSIRQRGIHAAGVIIAPDDLTNYIPVCTAKDSELLITQFDGKLIEDAGMLKMDFLGVRNLTIIKNALELIEESLGDKVDIDNLSLDDPKTFKLYQAGRTVGTFQFESEGMRGHLRNLKPTNIEDLIAMNALYRPGPMEFIPLYIKRKHGKEKVEYPHELLKEILEPTYGIMVYQEQIMQTAQIIGGFSLGKADILRRAMGKKKMDVMASMKSEFIEGAGKKDIDEKKADEIFGIMEKFAQYGFNRSHSAAYSIVAYQTGYLKANYPAHYMAAVLTNSMDDMTKIINFINECKKIKVKVFGPDVNESISSFGVNDKGEIRFGMAAIKGVGESAVKALIEEREARGPFTSIFDITERVESRYLNRKVLESLAASGAFDNLDKKLYRSQYLEEYGQDSITLVERALKWGQKVQEQNASAQQSLFGEGGSFEISTPPYPEHVAPWPVQKMLLTEKELIGFYISGHPLDSFALEVKECCTSPTQENLEEKKKSGDNKEIYIGGMITGLRKIVNKKGKPMAYVKIEDYDVSHEVTFFEEVWIKSQHLLEEGAQVAIKGKITNKYKSEELTINPTEVIPLTELRARIKRLVIRMSLEDLADDLFENLKQEINLNGGEVPLQFEFQDMEANKFLQMSSAEKLHLNDELLERLYELPNISFRIETN